MAPGNIDISLILSICLLRFCTPGRGAFDYTIILCSVLYYDAVFGPQITKTASFLHEGKIMTHIRPAFDCPKVLGSLSL